LWRSARCDGDDARRGRTRVPSEAGNARSARRWHERGNPPLPACAPYQYRIAEDDNGDKFRVLDEEDVAKLNALILGLAHGTCRLPTTPPPRRSEQPPEPTRKGLDT
jgi:hypothetical protein